MILNKLSGKRNRRPGSFIPMILIGWFAKRHSVLAPQGPGGRPADLLEKIGVYCWMGQELIFQRDPAFENGRVVPQDLLKQTFS